MRLQYSLPIYFFHLKVMNKNNYNDVVTAASVSKSFGDQEVLKDISFSLRGNEKLVVLGKSGSGKSVLIKCLVRLMLPDSGSIKIFGEEVTSLDHDALNQMRKRIGFLFQSAALYDSMSVRQNLEFPLRRVKKIKDKNVLNEKVEEVLANVNLSDAVDKMPSELSGGMRKRIGLARTLIMDPEIILYDEPTTGLDPLTSVEICELINELQEKYSSASIIITHDLNVVKITSTRLMMIRDGKVHAEGTYKLIGQEGKGFSYILDGMNAERILVASDSLGDARWFTEKAVAYAGQRVIFGRPIGANQGVQFPIARAHVNIEAADLMRTKAARMFDAGIPCGPEANMAKYLASEAAIEAGNACIDCHGGYGFAEEYDIERKFRESRLYRAAPINNNLVLAYVGEHVLGMPRSVLLGGGGVRRNEGAC